MGYYIQGPALRKAHYIHDKYGASYITQEEAKRIIQREPDRAIICVVDNGPFEAAGYCFNMREFEAFSDPSDNRPKQWLVMSKKKVHELTGYVP